jgi:hypothetical protein
MFEPKAQPGSALLKNKFRPEFSQPQKSVEIMMNIKQIITFFG